MERAEAIKKLRQMSLPKETMEILEALAPELKESEDERIRKYLIEELKAAKSIGELKFTIPQPTREECIAYLEKQKEQKLEEWNEEDEKNLELVTDCVYEFYPDPVMKYKLKDWLKSLRPQSKQEWSEDKDFEDCLTELACELYEQRDESPENTAFKENEILKKWTPILLKKARRKAEWNEENEQWLESIIKDYEDNLTKDKDHAAVIKIKIDFLKSLRPSWRPSEEQMEALKCAILDVARFSKRGGRQVELENEPYYSALHSLYCNLEKLM